jgi:hypothetical protein
VKHKKKGGDQVKVKKKGNTKRRKNGKERTVCCVPSLVALSTISKAGGNSVPGDSCRLHLKAMAWYMEKIYMMALLYPFCIIAFSNKYRIFKRKDPFFFTFSVHLY